MVPPLPGCGFILYYDQPNTIVTGDRAAAGFSILSKKLALLKKEASFSPACYLVRFLT